MTYIGTPQSCHEKANNSYVYNPLPAEIFHFDFHPLEIVSRYRDPQLQVGGNYSRWFNNA